MRGLLYIVILLLITGCSYSSEQNNALDEARSMMQTDPSGALSRLNMVDVSELEDSASIAQWALLYSEALAENHLAAPSDTIINIAIDYFGRHNITAEHDKAVRLKNLLRSSGMTDSLATALYLQKEKEFMLYQERAKRRTITLTCLIILLAASGIIVWMRQRLKTGIAKNEALMAEASGLRNLIELTSGNVGRLESKLHNLLESRFALVDSLCQTYYESQGTKLERKAIIDRVKSEIESVRSDSFPEMEKAVNDCRGNMLVKVLENFPEIKADDYHLLVYLACGLSSRTICLLLDETIDVVYKRKSRLKSRLKERVAPDCPEIMSVF